MKEHNAEQRSHLHATGTLMTRRDVCERKLNDAERSFTASVRAAMEAGLSMREIARYNRVSHSFVARRLEKYR